MIKHIVKLTILFSFLAFLNIETKAQKGVFTLGGTVFDSAQAVVPGVRVKLVNIATGREYVAQSDAEGEFIFRNLVSSKYKFIADANGFSTKTFIISIENSDILNVDVMLSAGNISEQVTVTATRTQISIEDAAVSVSIIDREQIERKNLNTAGDVFRNIPGVSTVNEGSFQVRPRIRGFDSNRVLVLIDGERLNNSRTSTTQSGVEVGLVGTEQIDSIEVVKGGGSVLYGTDALGGTINIITKDAPRNTDTGFRLGAVINGFFSTNERGRRGNIAAIGSGKRFSFRIAQSMERYDEYSTGELNGNLIDGVEPGGRVLNSQSHGSNTKLTGRVFFDDDNEFRLSYDRRRVGNIGVPTLVGVFNAAFPFSNRDKLNLRYESRALTKNLARISGTFYLQNQEREFVTLLNVPAFPPFFPGQTELSETVTNTDSIGFDFQSDWTFGKYHFLTTGFSFFRDANQDNRFRDALEPNFQTFPPTLTRITDTTPSVPNANFGSVAFFLQDQISIGDRMKIVGGIRAERFFTNSTATNGFTLPALLTPEQIISLGLAGLAEGLAVDETAITGDIGGVYHLTADLSLTARIGRSFRVPNLFERFFTGAGSIGGLVVGNPTLDPETGTNFDTGIRLRSSKISTSFTYFNNTYRNLLSNEPVGIINGTPVVIPNGLYQTVNIGRARIQGFEADVELPIKLGSGYLTPNGSISYLRGDDLEADEPLTTITPFKTVLNIQWQNFLNSYYVDWTTRFISQQKRLSDSFLLVNGGPEPGFVVSDLGGGYVFKRDRYRLRINIAAKNLFNRLFNEQYVLAPARGRSYVIGTTLEIN